MRIVLPLAALVLGAVVVVYAGLLDRAERGPGVVVSETLGTDRRMVSPRLSGQDARGRPYFVTAQSATQVPGNDTQVTMTDIEADLLLEDGREWIALFATSGRVDSQSEELLLSGEISIYSDSGYEFHATEVQVTSAGDELKSSKPVSGHGPLGALTANSMTAREAGDFIRFDGNVRVIIFATAG